MLSCVVDLSTTECIKKRGEFLTLSAAIFWKMGAFRGPGKGLLAWV